MTNSKEASIELINDKIVLWQDHTHPEGYRPTLKMLVFPDGRLALELNAFGKVTVVPYVKAEVAE